MYLNSSCVLKSVYMLSLFFSQPDCICSIMFHLLLYAEQCSLFNTYCVPLECLQTSNNFLVNFHIMYFFSWFLGFF